MQPLNGGFLTLFSLAVLFFSTALAGPIEANAAANRYKGFPNLPGCKKPIVRKEWRKLSSREKSNYIKAVQCIANKPSITPEYQATSHVFESFQAVHNNQTNDIHFVGHFLSWHRYFTWAYEKALRERCGYKGAQPYWDWIIDAETTLPMDEFEVFDPETGFGGNGPFVPIEPSEDFLGIPDRTGGGCVPNGPFTQAKGFTLNIEGLDLQTKNPHCLSRDFAPVTFRNLVQRSVIDELKATTNFEQFAFRMESIPSFAVPNIHGGGHFGVGGVRGTMGNAFNSPGDPVFYLHHANLDRIWWEWQEADKSGRRYLDVGGPIKPFDYTNQRGANVTLAFNINLNPIEPSVPLAALQYTRGPLLCYVYE